jgi:DSF synthase
VFVPQKKFRPESEMNAMADVRFLTPANASQVDTRFDPEHGIYWAFMNPTPRPCFNTVLLAQLRNYIDTIVDNNATIKHEGAQHQIRYGVLASKTPGVFNLGGDLALFRHAIETRSRAELVRYGGMCIDDLYPWHRNCDLPMTTMALVQGDALGGGFEAALSASVLVAEDSARMGFPEILFNLFPGMGAYSFLLRKVGRRTTDELVTSGNIYTARQLYDMGVVDVITPDGTGEAAVVSYVRKHSKSGNGRRAIESVRNDISPVTREELDRVVGIWADAALCLEDRDLRMMDRLVRAQRRIVDATEANAFESNVVQLQAVGAAD